MIRNLIVGYEPREKPPKEFYEAINEIRMIGKNINQIAKYGNSKGYVNGVDLKMEIEKLDNLILDLKRKYLLPKEVT